MLLRNARNQQMGAHFEKVFALRAAALGLLALRNGQAVKWLAGGRMVAQKCQLDWTLVRAGGGVAFVDTKVVSQPYFLRSRIDEHQLALAMQISHQGARSGFAVYFSATDEVCWFPAPSIIDAGLRARFYPATGVHLGHLVSFSLAEVFRAGATDHVR